VKKGRRTIIKKPTVWSVLIYLSALAIIVCIGLTIQSFTAMDEKAGHESDNYNYSVQAVKIPEKLEFAGEEVPLKNFDTRESLDRELLINTYFHSQTLIYIKKANRYFPVIEKVLKENDIPEDFKYLILAESGLANVVSPKKAVGFWQLMEETARDYGLEVSKEVDERYNLEKATGAACKYFRESYEKYNSWTLAAASFNAGRRGINRQTEKQKQDNYYDLLLSEETARYIFRVLAFKLVLSNPEDYGFYLDKNDLYPDIPYYEVEVDSTITDIAEFALAHSTNYKIIKWLNPWLRENSLTCNNHKTYIIRIPKEGAREIAF
jgi:membrane-bound lytic murein transglycosylase D